MEECETDGRANNWGRLHNLVAVSNALNQTTTLGGYDANGRPGAVTDPNGLVTVLSH